MKYKRLKEAYEEGYREAIDKVFKLIGECKDDFKNEERIEHFSF
jgi:hypothetical protein